MCPIVSAGPLPRGALPGLGWARWVGGLYGGVVLSRANLDPVPYSVVEPESAGAGEKAPAPAPSCCCLA